MLFSRQLVARFAGPCCTSGSRILLLLLVLALPAGSADEKRIAIYGATTNYSLPVVDRNGHEYVGLLEIIEPLGNVTARVDGSRWKIRYNNLEADFTSGKTRAKIHGKDLELSSNFVLESGRGLVSIASLAALLPRILGTQVAVNEGARRVFVGDVATHFTAQLNRTTPLRLVMNFTAPVNPTIATEPGRLRMVFHREPIVAPGSSTLTFDDKTIPSATYSENNGTAEIDVNSNAPLMASFSNEGHTITISAASPTSASVPGTSAPVASTTPNPASAAPAPAVQQTAPRHFFAVVDASHGGDDPGVALASQLLEKDVTLSLARRLRQELESRGISTLSIRDTDGGLTLDQRAAFANTAHPAIYIALHAASDGKGVRVFTSLMPAGGENNGPFVAWDTAQTAFLPASQLAAQGVSTELQKRQVQVRTLAAPLRPLNNVTAAAIAIEMAPPSATDVMDLNLAGYQQNVASAIANGVMAVRDRLGVSR